MFLYIDDSRCDLLPFYVMTLGSDYDQTRVSRPEGYIAHHIFCVEKGSGVFETPRGKVTLEEGSVIFMRKGYPTCYYPAGEEFKVGFITFDGECVDRLLDYYRAEGFLYCKSETLVSMIGHCARVGSKNATPDTLSHMLYEILAHFFARTKGSRATPSLARAKNYVEQYYYDAELSVAEIARNAGISQSLLFRLFREEEHVTPVDYLRRFRIRRAKQLLLQNPGARISDVAARCGFSDSSYFCKVFRDLTDMTPKEFLATYVF